MPVRVDDCHRKGIKKDNDVSTGDTPCGIPRGPGVSIGVVSRPPQCARRAMVLLAAIRDSRYGSVAFRVCIKEERK